MEAKFTDIQEILAPLLSNILLDTLAKMSYKYGLERESWLAALKDHINFVFPSRSPWLNIHSM